MASIDGVLELVKVTGTQGQILALYEILNMRTHNISNTTLPTIKQHIKFVRNHPYRFWYLVNLNSDCIGSAYVMDNNCVGINLVKNIDFFPDVLNLILKKHKPLKEIKSVRPPYFYINIATDNKLIKNQLIKLNAQEIQSTFILHSI